MRMMIELKCQRIPKDTTYNGAIVVTGEPGVQPEQRLHLEFRARELQDVGISLHHLMRAISDLTQDEFCVRMTQSAPNAVRPPVPMDLTPQQVNQIYESPESASLFFAPRFRTRKLKPGENVADVITEEVQKITEGE